MTRPVALHVERVAGASPRRAALFLHGILGSGANLRTLARRFVDARPDWEVLLVDLRGHGRSPKGTPAPTVLAAARDVIEVAARAPTPVEAILGHSFGGKVALDVVRLTGEHEGIDTLRAAVIVDSVPGERPDARGSEATVAVVALLEDLVGPFPKREAFVDAVVARGHARPFAWWLGMNLAPGPEGWTMGLDLVEIQGLLGDYFTRDLWPVVEDPPLPIHLVVGDRSEVFSPADRARAEALVDAAGRITLDVLPAGHWVHVDDPEGLLRVLLTHLGG